MTELLRNRRQSAEADGLQPLEHEVARILAQTDQPVEVYAATLRAIGLSLGWELGAAWELETGGRGLRCVRTWHRGGGTAAFDAMSSELTLTPGEGLPGRVLASGEAAWILDVAADPNFPRAEAARRSGLR
jgi:hypothetical protein